MDRSHPIRTEVRHLVNRWLAGEALRHQALLAAALRPEVQREAARLLHSHRRTRANMELRRMLAPYAHAFVELGDRLLVALSLRPFSEPLLAAPSGRDNQGGVAMWAVSFGLHRDRNVVVGSGLWAFAATTHAVEQLTVAAGSASADMLSIVLVGSSRTRLVPGEKPRVYTPRGYFDEPPL